MLNTVLNQTALCGVVKKKRKKGSLSYLNC